MDLQSASLMARHLSQSRPKFKVYSMELIKSMKGNKPAWGSLECRMENLMEMSSECTAMNFWVHVAHTD